MRADEIVTKALTGRDGVEVSVGGKTYTIQPPTIRTMASACVHLADIGDAETLNDILRYIVGMEENAKALSVFIAGDESLTEELLEAPFDDVVSALSQALELIDARNFLMLLASVRNVQRLIAKPK